MNNSKLRKDIEDVINRNSAENGSDTPDFILADYLLLCLDAFDKAVHARSDWFNHHCRIGGCNHLSEKVEKVDDNTNSLETHEVKTNDTKKCNCIKLRCASCHYFEHLKTINERVTEGLCRRYPPSIEVLHTNSDNNNYVPGMTDIWPLVLNISWCGEWMQKT